MRTVKKSAAILLSLLLITSALVVSGVSIFAASEYKITVKSTQNLFSSVSKMYKPGDTFDLVYFAKAKDKLVDGKVELKYDNEFLNIEKKKGAYSVEMGDEDSDCQSMGNYSDGEFIFSYTSSAGLIMDYSKEHELIIFHFKISNTINADQTIEFNINLLGAAKTKLNNDGDEVIDGKNFVNYIKQSIVTDALKSDFNVRTELTGGTEVKPETQLNYTTNSITPSLVESSSSSLSTIQSEQTSQAFIPSENTDASETVAANTESSESPSASETIADKTEPSESSVVMPTETIQDIFGDANNDKRISINDVTLIQKHIARLVSLSEDIQKRCDVNGDGRVTIQDGTCIQWYLVKINSRAGKTGAAYN